MYLLPLKTSVVEALRATFDGAYPESDFRTIKIGIEYPVAEADYPGIWVNWDDTQELTVAGINHAEIVTHPQGGETVVTRWRFGGMLTMTVVALSALEKDRLFDEMIKVLGVARTPSIRSEFRERIEDNDLLAMNGNFDLMRVGGDSAAPGTPWGTGEFIYEKSISIDMIGEFLTEPDMVALLPLRGIRVLGYVEGSPEAPFQGEVNPDYDPDAPGNFEVRTPDGWL